MLCQKVPQLLLSRRYSYKIVLSIGHVRVKYGNSMIDLKGLYLFYANPHTPYAAEIVYQT